MSVNLDPDLSMQFPENHAESFIALVGAVCGVGTPITLSPVLLRQYLAQVVLDPEVLAAHAGWFLGLVAKPEGSCPFLVDDVARMARHGLAQLAPDELILLVYSPVTLARVRAVMVNAPPPSEWQDDLCRLANRYGPADPTPPGPSGGTAEARMTDGRGPTPESDSRYLGAEVVEGATRVVTTLQVFNAFSQRLRLESDSIYTIAALPPTRREELVDELQRLVEQSWTAEGDAFAALDVQFHVTLAAVGCPYFDIRPACQFVFDQGDRHALTADRRRAVCGEHQVIVNAIRAEDYELAATASRRHLIASRSRWLPEFEQRIIWKNIAFYRDMRAAEENFLCVSALNVTPVEMDPRFRATVGRAAAEAVGRGARLVYLRPCQQLLDRWAASGLKELGNVSEGEIHSEFEDFQDFVVQVLMEASDKPEAVAREAVVGRLSQFLVDDDALFLLTRPSGTIGYFRYQDGRDELTYREALTDGEAWPEIMAASPTRLNRQLFLMAARGALERFAAGCLDPEVDSAARMVAERWLGGVAEPEAANTRSV